MVRVLPQSWVGRYTCLKARLLLPVTLPYDFFADCERTHGAAAGITKGDSREKGTSHCRTEARASGTPNSNITEKNFSLYYRFYASFSRAVALKSSRELFWAIASSHRDGRLLILGHRLANRWTWLKSARRSWRTWK